MEFVKVAKFYILLTVYLLLKSFAREEEKTLMDKLLPRIVSVETPEEGKGVEVEALQPKCFLL